MMIPVMIVTWFGISIEACLVCHNILGVIDFGARRSSTHPIPRARYNVFDLLLISF